MRKAAFCLYIVFVVSWFLHLAARLPFLGSVRFDLLLVCAITGLLIASAEKSAGHAGHAGKPGEGGSRVSKLILTLVVYSIVTLPFVQWPGTVLNAGLPDYVKALVFYFFTSSLVTTPSRLAVFLTTFVATMTFRVLEPLYLHVTTGYWGSYATMAGAEYLNRLSGSPYDIINPNGLAFVTLTVLPFFHYLGPLTTIGGGLYAITVPLLLWALILTGSRSGLIGLGVVILAIWLKSARKPLLTTAVLVAIGASIVMLPPDLADRYLSIASSNTKNAETAEGRLSGLGGDLRVAMRRPIFGHGLGTSVEANANFNNIAMVSHNLYLETAQELGFVGLLILIALLVTIATNVRASLNALRRADNPGRLWLRLADAVQVWLAMNILFSFASDGLRSYEWYLAAGLSDILNRAANRSTSHPAASALLTDQAKGAGVHPLLAGVIAPARPSTHGR